MRLDLDAGDDRLHVAAGIEQRSQARPALLAHAVAFVENRDAAANHRGDQGRRDVAQLPFAFDHRRDEQILGPRVHCRLENVDIAAQPLPGRISQRGLTDARLAEQARIHRQVLRVDHHPGGEQLPHHLFLPHPADGQLVRVREMQSYAFNLALCSFGSALRLATRIQ